MNSKQIVNQQNNKQIQEKIHEIADIVFNKEVNELSLLGGAAGNSIFHIYYSKVFQNEEHNDKAIELITDIFDKISKGFSFHTFAGGLAGIGWLIEFLTQNEFLDCDTNETIGELDDYLHKLMIEEIKHGNFDYLHGAGGIALYFLKRTNFSKREEYLSEFVDILDEISIKENNTCKWISDINVKDDKKEEVYNLSMSHGISSIISVLSKIYKQNINKEKTRNLLEGAVNYLLSNEQDHNEFNSYFPGTVALKDHKPGKGRLAWCYGDLGVGVALWNASKSLDNKDLENKSIEILLFTAQKRDLKENMVVDAGICHGTVGNAHIFKRMYINTGIEEFNNTAEYWYDETLKMAKHEDTLSGYKSFRTEEYGGWKEEFGFLEGIAGIGLSLLSAISDIDPKWDEILLLS